MFALFVASVLCGQGPAFVKDYTPEVGDTVVLARDEPGRRVPIVKTAGAALSFWSIIQENDDFQYEAIVDGDQLTEIEAGTPAQLVDVTNTRTPIFMVEILGGPKKGQTTFTYAPYCRKLDPAALKKNTAARKKRGPLDKKTIVADIKAALEKAKPNDAVAGLDEKKVQVAKAIEPVSQKHKADFIEVFKIASQAAVVVSLNGNSYDIAGNRLRR